MKLESESNCAGETPDDGTPARCRVLVSGRVACNCPDPECPNKKRVAEDIDVNPAGLILVAVHEEPESPHGVGVTTMVDADDEDLVQLGAVLMETLERLEVLDRVMALHIQRKAREKTRVVGIGVLLGEGKPKQPDNPMAKPYQAPGGEA